MITVMHNPASSQLQHSKWVNPASELKIPPELEIMLCCAQSQVKAEKADRVRDLIAQGIDWQFLIERTVYHKVLPLVYTNLKTICPRAIPTDALTELHHLFHWVAQHNMRLSGELVRALKCLGEQNIAAVPYKGPVLANALYGNIALRQSSDLDILVLQQDVLRVKALLISLGYQPKLGMTAAQEQSYLNSNTEHTYDFFHPGKQIAIELHWRIEPKYSAVIEPHHFWHKLELTNFAGVTIANLPLEEWLPILCVHASRHIWERLMWLCDVAELLEVQPDIHWQTILAQADQLGYKRILLVGLYLTHRLLEAQLPPEVLREIIADRQVERLTSKLCRNFAAGIEADQEFLGTTLYHLQIRERFQDKAMYFRSFLHWLAKRH